MTTPVLNKTTRQLIVTAFRATGIVPAEQSLQPFQFERGLEIYNDLIKHWQAKGLLLWSRTEAVLPLIKGQTHYDLGPTGAECANADSFFATNLEADEVATDTVLEVFDVTGLVGVTDILTASPTASVSGWTAINSGTLASDGTNLTVTNGAAVAGGAEYTLDVETGEEYLISFTYTQGTSTSADFSAVSGSVLSTINLTATGAGELRFTANSDAVTFRVENGTTTSGHDSDISLLNYQKISSGERFGVALDDGTRQWSYLISTDTSTSPPTVRISQGLTSAASTGNIVYMYSDKIDRPLRIESARYADRSDRSEIPLDRYSRQEYFDQPDKTSEGTVSQWYYDPQLTNGRLYVWQTASHVNNVLRFTYQRPLLVSQTTADAPDIPAEWFETMKWNMAKAIAIEYGVKGRLQEIKEMAAMTSLESEGFDVEDDSFQIVPDYTGA